MIAQEVFNLPTIPGTAPQGGVWGLLTFLAVLVAVVVYLVRHLPRVSDAQMGQEERRPGAEQREEPPEE